MKTMESREGKGKENLTKHNDVNIPCHCRRHDVDDIFIDFSVKGVVVQTIEISIL